VGGATHWLEHDVLLPSARSSDMNLVILHATCLPDARFETAVRATDRGFVPRAPRNDALSPGRRSYPMLYADICFAIG
jgi:hypothetical protein